MKTIKDYCPKPSDAVRAMVDGVREALKRKDFKVHMDTFGHYFKDTCMGCAATCAIQKATGHWFTPNEIMHPASRSTAIDVPIDDLDSFEWVIDQMRAGNFFDLLLRYDVPYELSDKLSNEFYQKMEFYRLENNNLKEWPTILKRYEEKLIPVLKYYNL